MVVSEAAAFSKHGVSCEAGKQRHARRESARAARRGVGRPVELAAVRTVQLRQFRFLELMRERRVGVDVRCVPLAATAATGGVDLGVQTLGHICVLAGIPH